MHPAVFKEDSWSGWLKLTLPYRITHGAESLRTDRSENKTTEVLDNA